jgi:chromosome segregation ATPase
LRLESKEPMQKLALVVTIGLLVVAGWLGVLAERGRKVAQERVAQLEGELAQRGVAIPAEAATVAEEVAPAPVKPAAMAREAVDVSRYLRMIDGLRERVQELEKEIQSARLADESAQERIGEQKEAVKKLNEQFASLKEDALRQQRVSEALDTELKFKAQRLTQVETSEKLLQEKLGKAEQAAKRVVVVSKEVEDLNRRRETTLLTLDRRFREVTDLYRNFSLSMQTRENAGQSLQAGDLSRIQTALQQAEEELRQLRSLNARVAEMARAK